MTEPHAFGSNLTNVLMSCHSIETADLLNLDNVGVVSLLRNSVHQLLYMLVCAILYA